MTQRRRGRPRKNTLRFDITLRLDPELDAELIAWLQALPKGKRPEAIKQLFYLGRESLSILDGDREDEELAEAAESVLGAWEF